MASARVRTRNQNPCPLTTPPSSKNAASKSRNLGSSPHWTTSSTSFASNLTSNPSGALV